MIATLSLANPTLSLPPYKQYLEFELKSSKPNSDSTVIVSNSCSSPMASLPDRHGFFRATMCATRGLVSVHGRHGMKIAVISVWFLAILPIAPADADAQETPAERYQTLSAEYESALRAIAQATRHPGVGEGRDAANSKALDLRPTPRAS